MESMQGLLPVEWIGPLLDGPADTADPGRGGTCCNAWWRAA